MHTTVLFLDDISWVCLRSASSKKDSVMPPSEDKVTSPTEAETSSVPHQQNSINNLASVVQLDMSCTPLPLPSVIRTHLVAQLQAEALRPICLLKSNLPPSPGVSALPLLRILCFISIKEQPRAGLVKTLVSLHCRWLPSSTQEQLILGCGGQADKGDSEHWDKHPFGANSKLC